MWDIFVFQNCTKTIEIILLVQCMFNIRSNANKVMPVVPHSSKDVKDMKYILLWEAKGAFKNIFDEGQEGFIQNDCPVNNCFVTHDRFMFGGGLKPFDTILFNGGEKSWLQNKVFPEKRYTHQKYAFVQRESAAKAYVCHEKFDYFFNWTITYKLDSDIVLPHIHTRDINMEVIGPRKDMHWITDMLEIDKTRDIATDLETKKKAVVWFDSKCDSVSNNSKFVNNLQKALKKHGLNIDVYGKCSTLHCPNHECDVMLDEDYYFYLALEDSIAVDYVTGGILRALRNNVVPIVYGGAKYDRFLPPQSYLDARNKTPEALATLINSLVKDKSRYRQHLRWKSHYSFCAGQGSPALPSKGKSYCAQTMCDLCEALHDPSLFGVHSVYKDFRRWWYPDYEQKCPKRRKAGATPSKPKDKTDLRKVMNINLPIGPQHILELGEKLLSPTNVMNSVMNIREKFSNPLGVLNNLKTLALGLRPANMFNYIRNVTTLANVANLVRKIQQKVLSPTFIINLLNTAYKEAWSVAEYVFNIASKYTDDIPPGIFPFDIHTLNLGVGAADRLADRLLTLWGWDIPGHGTGGFGGWIFRNSGWYWAQEINRIRGTLMSNNFEID